MHANTGNQPQMLAEADRLRARDLAVLWHPCTQMAEHPDPLPLVPIRRGRGAWLEGVDGVRYLDAVTGTGTVAGNESLSFDRETDRIYYEVPRPLMLRAPGPDLEVAMEGFRDAVVWNPWAERCAALPDMPDDGYRRMLCIEAAVIDKPVTLASGGSWSGRQLLTVR